MGLIGYSAKEGVKEKANGGGGEREEVLGGVWILEFRSWELGYGGAAPKSNQARQEPKRPRFGQVFGPGSQ